MKELDVHTRIQLRNILFATDFSPAAGAAAPYAAELARHYGARLYALHVRPPAVDPLAPPESWNRLEEAAKIEAEREKRELIEAFTGVQPQVLMSARRLGLRH